MNMTPEDATLRDKIWKTMKSRMRAESRYRSYDLAAHLLTTYYSLSIIFAAVFSDDLRQLIPQADKIVIALSILVFSLSLVLLGFRFSETASKHRECYLRLQRLHNDAEPMDLPQRYHDILEHYPNHAERDYNDMVVQAVTFSGKSIKVAGSAEEIKPSNSAVAAYVGRWLAWRLSYLVAAATPIAFVLVVAWR
jgi:hypothetical protein